MPPPFQNLDTYIYKRIIFFTYIFFKEKNMLKNINLYIYIVSEFYKVGGVRGLYIRTLGGENKVLSPWGTI